MPSDEEKSRIEKLRKSLYSKSNPPPAVVKRRRMHEIPHPVEDNFAVIPQTEEVEEKKEVVYSGKYNPLFKGLLIFAIFFFIASAAIATFVYFRGSNIVSPGNITLSVISPVSVAAGDALSIDVDVTNRNNTPLQLADLTFDYPDGTKSAADFTTALKSDDISIDALAAGQTIRKTDKAVLYGAENTKADIKITLTYRIPGSNAVFTKDTDYIVLIASAPVSMNIDMLKSITSNQNLSIGAHIVSNSSEDLQNVLFKIDYPFGFTFLSATPTPTYQNNIWSLSTLSNGESRDIAIVGKMTGQNDEQRVFHFYTGTASSSDDSNISTLFINNSETVAIEKPFLDSQIALDGDYSPVHTIQTGKIVRAEIDWHNNLTTPVSDASISLKIDGSIIDQTSVNTEQGFYNSVNSTMTWNKSEVGDLATILPGASGKVYFTFSTYKSSFEVSKSFHNPVINMVANIQAKRFSDNNVPEVITSSASNTAEVASDLTLTSSAVYSVGPFTNTGSLPPKANSPTTYTVNLALTNSYNQVDNAVVTLTLPPYVTWLGKIAPAGQNVSYNSTTRQVTWQAGEIEPATGFNNSPLAMSFQVSLIPSISQIATTPDIIDNIQVQGTDNFTGTSLINANNPVTIRINTDPNFQNGDDQVVGN